MKALLVALAVAAACSPAFARIGETKEECEKRYGKIRGNIGSREHPESPYFRKDGFSIVVQFEDNKAAWMEYSKSVGEWTANPDRLDDAEIELLLKSNGGTRKWLRTGEGWRTDDGELYARYSARNRLFIWTRAFTAKQLKGL